MGQTNTRFSRLRSLLVLDAATAARMEQLPAADALILDLASASGPRPTRTAQADHVGTVVSRMRARAYRPVLLVRIAADWAAVDDHLDGVMASKPDGVVFAGCTTPGSLQRLGVKLSVREATHGIADGSTAVVADIGGNPAALLAASFFHEASTRLAALTWDAGALAAQCGATPGIFAEEGGPSTVVRTLLALAAAAAGVPAFDTASATQGEMLARDCTLAKRLGFRGKIAREPGQVAVIDSVFPSSDGTKSVRAQLM